MGHDPSPSDEARGQPPRRPPPARGGRPGRATRRLDPASPCLNCGDATPGEYCPSCGQRKTAVQVSIRAMAAEALEDELTVDQRLPRTLHALFLRPGQLTVEYVNGRIVRYIRPVRLYLVSSVIFFLLLSFTSLRFVREAPVDPSGEPVPADTSQPAAAAVDTAAMSAVAVDSALATVRAALQQEGLSAAQRDSLRTVRNDLIRHQARLRATGATGATAATRADATDADSIRPASPAEQPNDPMAFLDDVNLRLGNPRLDAAAAAKIRELRRMEPRQAVERVLSDFIRFIPTVMFLLLPFFAGILKVLYVRRRRYYAEHFIFLLHTHAFIYLLFTVLLLAVVLGWARPWLFTAALGWMLVYTFLGMRRVYGQGRLKTFAKLWILGWIYFWILATTVPLVFLATVVLA
jgi:hypothetical protein